jgi:TonB family protein
VSGFFAVLQSFLLISFLNQAAADQAKPTDKKTDAKSGYVDCSSRDPKALTPILLDPCMQAPVGNLGCGQQIGVLERNGIWLKIALPDGTTRYIANSAVSQVNDKLVVFDAESGIPDQAPPKCPSSHGVRPPRPIFTPDPEYTREASRAHIQGTVSLLLTVDTEGHVSDVKLERKLGHGLDEKAIEAVRRWKFEPGRRDDKPVAVKLSVEVKFSLYN